MKQKQIQKVKMRKYQEKKQNKRNMRLEKKKKE